MLAAQLVPIGSAAHANGGSTAQQVARRVAVQTVVFQAMLRYDLRQEWIDYRKEVEAAKQKGWPRPERPAPAPTFLLVPYHWRLVGASRYVLNALRHSGYARYLVPHQGYYLQKLADREHLLEHTGGYYHITLPTQTSISIRFVRYLRPDLAYVRASIDNRPEDNSKLEGSDQWFDVAVTHISNHWQVVSVQAAGGAG